VRAADAFDPSVDLTHKRANHLLLSELLRRKGEILEIPVQFFPISPERVKRTSPIEGLHALGTIVWRRMVSPRPPETLLSTASSVADEPSSNSVRSSR
jgi:hypothetical protein